MNFIKGCPPLSAPDKTGSRSIPSRLAHLNLHKVTGPDLLDPLLHAGLVGFGWGEGGLLNG